MKTKIRKSLMRPQLSLIRERDRNKEREINMVDLSTEFF